MEFNDMYLDKIKTMFEKSNLPCGGVSAFNEEGKSIIMFHACSEDFYNGLFSIQNNIRMNGFPYNFLLSVNDYNTTDDSSVSITLKDFTPETFDFFINLVLDWGEEESEEGEDG